MNVNLSNLEAWNVLSVYSGKDGKCCCGCAGKHYYNPAYLTLGGERRGYAVEDDECSARMVKKVVKLLKENAADVEVGDNNLAVVIGKRVYIAYPIA